ncbi:MAG: Methionine import system permease protein MetP [Peptostreptococcus russellii]|uniref:methionine ABC transporter permease n=1 Tax=Peptostreptococcus russellii TaxID=215200 RepID=UPI0030361A22
MNSKVFEYLPTVILPALWATLKIMFFSAIISMFLGLIFGTILYMTNKDGLWEKPFLNAILGKITDVLRAFPTIILIVSLAPLTRALVGSAVGTNAAIVGITFACTPFASRMIENSLQTVDIKLIKAAKSFGASNFEIIYRVLLVEALPSIISNYTILLINMLNVSTIAGAVGAGGLGAIALTYGYQRFDYGIMYFIVAILLIMVLCIQSASKLLYEKLK